MNFKSVSVETAAIFSTQARRAAHGLHGCAVAFVVARQCLRANIQAAFQAMPTGCPRSGAAWANVTRVARALRGPSWAFLAILTRRFWPCEVCLLPVRLIIGD